MIINCKHIILYTMYKQIHTFADYRAIFVVCAITAVTKSVANVSTVAVTDSAA